MKRLSMFLFVAAVLAIAGSALASIKVIELEASKDTFGRSNQRNLNNGKSPQLLIAQMPQFISLVAFDLAPVTNEVVSAELQLWMHNTVGTPVSIVIANMVQTKNNAGWIEGSGSLGARGTNAKPGEATYGWCGFRDLPWENAKGAPLESLGDSNLWKSHIAKQSNIQWVEGGTIKADAPVAWIEQVRTSEIKTVTFGIWGVSGNGFYEICSRECTHPPKLELTVKEKEVAK